MWMPAIMFCINSFLPRAICMPAPVTTLINIYVETFDPFNTGADVACFHTTSIVALGS